MLKSLLILLLITLSTSKLHQVVSLFRHGARYHLNTLYDGNSTYNIWGELTPVGMRQHQTLGKTLNKEYIQNLKFLPVSFDKKQVEVYSTDFNRTIQSAMSQLYGLYPPGNGPKLQTVQTKYHLPPFTNQTDIDEQKFAFPQGHQHIMIKYDPTMMLENCPKYN
jgi:lysosomal acid phosphatase